ncbi:hypothetical protein [Curtobacterium pusillum]|uniref:hypothetical protein n=1 Tax=Curtobacterium pusillum TaxID=69373 RepID=UPI001643F25B|nr:hypothetical protein [Curtobacterium pusillum]
MSTYESNADVQPMRVVTYRHLRRATRRGWALPAQAEPSIADLVGDRGPSVVYPGRRRS